MNPLRKILLYSQGIIGLNDEDWLLSSFPRSGNTWVRFLLCNLISLLEWDGRTVDFPLLNQTMVEIGVNNLLQPWPHPTIPRVVKTHRFYLSLFARARGSIGIIRDPKDVMVSYYHYKKDRRKEFKGTFSKFIRNHHLGLRSWFRHYLSWKDHWTLIVRYEDMKQNTFREFKRILNTLQVSCPDNLVHESIRRSNLKHVRQAESNLAAGRNKQGRFARSGQTQQWEPYFSSEDLAYYRDLVDEYGIRSYSKAAKHVYRE
jgi:hypothetical protein